MIGNWRRETTLLRVGSEAILPISQESLLCEETHFCEQSSTTTCVRVREVIVHWVHATSFRPCIYRTLYNLAL